MATKKKNAAKAAKKAAADAVPIVDFDRAVEEPKSVLVGMAVSAQLSADGRWPPPNLSKVMGNDYGYAQMTMRNFLDAVKYRLKAGRPTHTFTYGPSFVAAALNATVLELTRAIDKATT